MLAQSERWRGVDSHAGSDSLLDEYASGSADFADYLILSLARAEGSKTLLTFDRRLLRTAGCEAP